MLRGERQSPYVFRILTKQGETRWVMETVTPFFFNGRPALLGNSMNITDRMEAEERLRESEDRYRTIFETTGTATIIVEEDTTVTLVNTEFEKLSGAPKDYWEGKRKWTEFVHDKDRERMLGYHYRRRVDPDLVPRNYEFSLLDRQGNVREVIITISLIPGTRKSVASFADISDRRRAEERLRESEDRYRTIFETTGTATIIVEEDTTVTLVNTEFEKLSGAPKDYWEGKRKWTEFVHEKDRDRMLGFHHGRRIDPESAPRNYEFSLVDMQGGVREVIITISLIPGTKRSVASFVDITERKQAEEALKKNERDLQDKTHELEELNAALRVLLKRREEDKLELENNVISNLKKLVIPYIEKIKKGRLEGNDLVSLNVIESNLKDIASPFASRLSSEYLSLTPKELQVADLIKEGKTTKEIAEFLSLSPATVEIHRYHIREKLGLSRKKANLRTYLCSLK
jgi:PAS domain S-box-containing protein